MSPSLPEYLLFAESAPHESGGRLWRFLLHPIGSAETISASHVEPGASDSRAELLAVVRGLEAIDQPGNVKLVTGSGYVSRGLARGLSQWRMQGWHWERFGRRVPIRDRDLWQRVDRALEFHTIRCHSWGEQETEPVGRASVATRPVRPGRRRARLATATQETMGAWRRGVGTLLNSRLAPAG